MPCPIEERDYVTTHAEAEVVVAMLNIHATTHTAAPREPRQNAKMEKRLSMVMAGTAETWSYFLTRWGERGEGH